MAGRISVVLFGAVGALRSADWQRNFIALPGDQNQGPEDPLKNVMDFAHAQGLSYWNMTNRVTPNVPYQPMDFVAGVIGQLAVEIGGSHDAEETEEFRAAAFTGLVRADMSVTSPQRYYVLKNKVFKDTFTTTTTKDKSLDEMEKYIAAQRADSTKADDACYEFDHTKSGKEYSSYLAVSAGDSANVESKEGSMIFCVASDKAREFAHSVDPTLPTLDLKQTTGYALTLMTPSLRNEFQWTFTGQDEQMSSNFKTMYVDSEVEKERMEYDPTSLFNFGQASPSLAMKSRPVSHSQISRDEYQHALFTDENLGYFGFHFDEAYRSADNQPTKIENGEGDWVLQEDFGYIYYRIYIQKPVGSAAGALMKNERMYLRMNNACESGGSSGLYFSAENAGNCADCGGFVYLRLLRQIKKTDVNGSLQYVPTSPLSALQRTVEGESVYGQNIKGANVCGAYSVFLKSPVRALQLRWINQAAYPNVLVGNLLAANVGSPFTCAATNNGSQKSMDEFFYTRFVVLHPKIGGCNEDLCFYSRDSYGYLFYGREDGGPYSDGRDRTAAELGLAMACVEGFGGFNSNRNVHFCSTDNYRKFAFQNCAYFDESKCPAFKHESIPQMRGCGVRTVNIGPTTVLNTENEDYTIQDGFGCNNLMATNTRLNGFNIIPVKDNCAYFALGEEIGATGFNIALSRMASRESNGLFADGDLSDEEDGGAKIDHLYRPAAYDCATGKIVFKEKECNGCCEKACSNVQFVFRKWVTSDLSIACMPCDFQAKDSQRKLTARKHATHGSNQFQKWLQGTRVNCGVADSDEEH